MRWNKSYVYPALLSLSLLVAAACSKKASEDSETVSLYSSTEDRLLLEQFVDAVILPTYQDLAARSIDLELAIEALLNTPSQDSFAAAQKAWVAARTPWEQSESFLFGPVDTKGFDPALDSWPLDHRGLEEAIAAFARDAGIEIAAQDPNLKGFHAIEFILFGYEKTKTLAQVTAEEKKYLLALAQHHRDITVTLKKAWETGIGTDKPFALELKTAGLASSNSYLSSRDAIQELLEGMVGIADEVANNKIGQPFNQKDPNLVESQFSFNSLEDFQNNILSIRYVYHGQRAETFASQSLAARIQSQNPALHLRLEQAIDLSLKGLKAIPDPFREAITNAQARETIVAAQKQILSLQSILDIELRAELAR